MRRDPGYLNVVAGVADPGGRTPLRPGRRLNDAEKKDLVLRLRARGWSYRRISDELDVSYALVGRWLDGPVTAEPAASPAPLPRRPSRPVAPPPRSPMPSPEIATPEASAPVPIALPESAMQHLIVQNQQLINQVERMAAANAAQKQAIDAMEDRLIAALDDRHRRLTDTLLGALKALFARIRPS